jgi:hypothetical protein
MRGKSDSRRRKVRRNAERTKQPWRLLYYLALELREIFHVAAYAAQLIQIDLFTIVQRTRKIPVYRPHNPSNHA